MMIRMLMMKMDKKMGISVCVCVYSILSPVCSPLTGALGAAGPNDDDDDDDDVDGDDDDDDDDDELIRSGSASTGALLGGNWNQWRSHSFEEGGSTDLGKALSQRFIFISSCGISYWKAGLKKLQCFYIFKLF